MATNNSGNEYITTMDSELKSQDTNITGILNHPIERVEDGHFLYRRGSTTVHVHAYAVSSADDKLEDKMPNHIKAGIKLLSGFLAMLVIVTTLVIKISSNLSAAIGELVEDGYMLTLYVLGSVWFTYYLLKGYFRQAEIKFSKTSRSSNRWLKGVLVLFGLAVVMKDGLEFLSYFMVNLSICPDKQLKIAVSVFHALFITAQVKYLFKYSKVYIKNCSSGSRTGLMLIIAINLSFWIAAIIDETVLALDNSSTSSFTITTTSVPEHFAGTNTTESHDTGHDEDPCVCHTSFCTTVHAAEKFLFPFAIEFSLVASSLVYITWSNVGKQPPPCEGVVKPSFKFYRAYNGAALGGFAFFVSVVIIIIMGTGYTSVSRDDRNYFTEFTYLIVFSSFLIGVQISMLLACFYGFYLFRKICRPLHVSELLDQALLIICLFGPMAADIFSILAVLAGNDNKIAVWEITFFNPFIDLFQSIFQTVFIVWGLHREPMTSMSSKEIGDDLQRGITEHLKGAQVDDDSDSSSSIASGFDNKTYLRSRLGSLTSVVSALANNQPRNATAGLNANVPMTNLQPARNTENEMKSGGDLRTISGPQILITSDDDSNQSENTQIPEIIDDTNKVIIEDVPSPIKKETILKIVKESRVSRPDKTRCRLRDVIMFLLITNASLWVFMSVNGTAFEVYLYQTEFFGSSAWTTIIMVCRPLSLFYHMHSAGCLFEMWSFA